MSTSGSGPPTIIALVGIDGAGKTTQAHRLAAWLTAQGWPADYHQNAGGRRWLGRLAQRLGRRDALDLLGPGGLLAVESALRWLAIGYSLLRSRLRGRIAVMDRYSYCQYVSIRAHGGRRERLARILYSTFPAPGLTCHLAVAPATAYHRIEVRATDHEDLAFLARVDAAYRALPEAARFTVVDAAGSPDEVHARLRRLVDQRTRGGVLPAAITARRIGTDSSNTNPITKNASSEMIATR